MEKRPLKSPTSQHEAFVAAAREHGCDEDPKAFDEKMREMLAPSKRLPKTAGKTK